MSYLSDMASPMRSTKSEVGFRFHPTDEELVDHYLMRKINGHDNDEAEDAVIPEIKVCDYEPWELPDLIRKDSNDEAWHFFSPCDYKYKDSLRFNRVTKAGFWKPTGKPRKVIKRSTKRIIGTKKSLVFYKKQHPKPIRTSFILHEYDIINSKSKEKSEFVLYKMKVKCDEKSADCGLDRMAGFPSDYASPMTVNSSCEENEIMSTVVDFEVSIDESEKFKDDHSGSDSANQIAMSNPDFEYQNQDQQNYVSVFKGNSAAGRPEHGNQNAYEAGSETSGESRAKVFEVESSATFSDQLEALFGSVDSFHCAVLSPGSYEDYLSYDYSLCA